jgi:spore germination cell wall hydrolase CwlJ-like protein
MTPTLCLVIALYNEAKPHPEAMMDVADVVMTRVERRQSDVCSIVKARYQFAFEPVDLEYMTEEERAVFDMAEIVAVDAICGWRPRMEADHFHAKWMNPKPDWAHRFQLIGGAFGHYFYDSKGEKE